VDLWSADTTLARNRQLGSVGLRLRPDGESDIIWNRGLELTPTDAQHRFAEAPELLAKLKNSPLSRNSTFLSPKPLNTKKT
jgi:hypothetical protein